MPPIDIQDSDLFIINRSDITYKVTADDLGLTGAKPINPSTGDISFNPAVPGTGTEADPFVLTSIEVEFGMSGYSQEEITIDNQKPGDLVIFTDENESTNGDRFEQTVGIIPSSGTYTTNFLFVDAPASSIETPLQGKLTIGTNDVYISWQVTVKPDTVAPEIDTVTLVETGDGSSRFTDQSFHTTVAMTEGVPVSTKSISYKVEGTLYTQAQTSEIVGENKVTVPGGWTNQTVGSIITNYKSVEYGNGIFMVVGNSTAYAFSPTGVGDWTTGSIGFGEQIGAITFGKGVFSAVGGTGYRYSTTDGTSWRRDQEGSLNFYDISFGDSKFVIVGSTGTLRVSPSGTQDFTLKTSNTTDNLRGVTYSSEKNLWVAVGDNGVCITSPDADTWTLRSTLITGMQSVTYGVNKFVAVGSSGKIQYSTDGINWPAENEVVVGSQTWRSVKYLGGKFVMVGTGGTNATSTDGINWTLGSDITPKNSIYDITYNGSIYLLGTTDGNVVTSPSAQDTYEAQTLTLADNTDLDKFSSGMLVKQNEAIPGTAPAFSTTLYTGNGGNLTTPPTGIDLESKALVWIKNRDTATTYHVLVDNVRPGYKTLCSNDPGAEAPFQDVLGFNSDTTVDITKVSGWINHSGNSEVMWSFRAAAKFFDIQTYTGDGVRGKTVTHNLNSVPGMIIVKDISTASDWAVYHKELGASKYLKLNDTQAVNTSPNYWNDEEPTNSVFTLGDMSRVNSNNDQYVAYLFADEPGLIKCGSYTGGFNKQIDCGFKPQWVMIKRSNGGSDWSILDQYRYEDPSGGKFNLVLKAQETDTERTDLANDRWILPNTNGFQLSSSNWADTNSSSGEYIFVAIAEDAMADASVTPAGLFQSYDDTTDPAAPTMTLTPQVDGWQANQDKKAVGPETVLDNATLWLETNNLREVTGTSNAPVYFERTALNDEITFNLPTGTGNTWDDEFPVDTTITSCVYAENDAGRSPLSGTECSNTVQPEGDPYEHAIGGLTTLYTGTGTTGQTITNGIDLAGEGGMVWIKNRDNANGHHCLHSSETLGRLVSNDNRAIESSYTLDFASDGFTVTSPSSSWENAVGANVAWTFQKAPGYFDIQTYSGDDVTGRTVSHDLTSAPGMILCKSTSNNEQWCVYHKSLGATDVLVLNDNAAASADNRFWNNTEPTTTEFTVGSVNAVNASGREYVAYLFADDTPNLIKCGSYTGTSTANIISTGFKTQWVLIKKTSGGADWMLLDDKRNPDRAAALKPNENDAEGFTDALTFNADDGFTLISADARFNTSGETYIYVAIAAPVVKSMTQEQVDATKLLFNTKEYRKQKHKQDIVSRAAELRTNFEAQGYTTAQIDTVLPAAAADPAPTPVAVSGYYPLYTSETDANNASSDGQSHCHTFNGTEYFMPNTGVTIYHGNYGSY